MPLKYTILSLSLFLLLSCKTKQVTSSSSPISNKTENFEGIIKYKFLMGDVTDLTMDEIDLQIKEVEPFFGKHMTNYIKEDKMKSVIDGEMMKMITYSDKTDSITVHAPDLGELSKVSAYDNWNFTYDTIVTTQNAMTIDGVNCDLISFKSDLYTWNYYYSNKLKVNPEHYKHYQSGFWNKAIEMCESLPMRFEGKVPSTHLFMQVDEIIPQALDDATFEMPEK